MSLFKKYLQSNHSFYKKIYFPSENNIVLFLVSKDIYTTSLSMKFAKACSEILEKNLLVVPNLTSTKKSNLIVNSFHPTRFLSLKVNFIKIFFFYFFKIFKLNLGLSTGKDLRYLKLDGVSVGGHLYDYILSKYKLISLKKITIKHRFSIFLDLIYYFCCVEIIKKEKNPIIILPDNNYRHGLIFKYAEKNSLNCLTSLSMTDFTIHKFDSPESYLEHCRTPSLELTKKIITNEVLMKNAKKSFADRIKGKGDQHDVIRAFSKDKNHISKEALIAEMKLDPSKPIILVAAHVFSDAPNGLNDLLFDDFHEWLIETCIELKKNEKINFIVKEHPSSSLYGESDKVFEVLKEFDLQDRILSDNINTSSLFNSVDVLITCGGTAAMEFAYFGVPNLIACKPHYYKFGFTDISKTKREYLAKLNKVHHKQKLSFSQKTSAIALMYIFDEFQKVDNLDNVVGSQKSFLGAKKDLEIFMAEMIQDTESQIGFNSLKKNLSTFFSQNERNLISNKLIHNFNLKV